MKKKINQNLHWRTARSAPPLPWSENFTRVVPVSLLKPSRSAQAAAAAAL
jgi:hypothetical protein